MIKRYRQEFERLACALSPENLSCDGELSPTETAKKYRKLMQKWRYLESRVGRKVSEDEVWRWQDENRKA